jgi:hypothetical protein
MHGFMQRFVFLNDTKSVDFTQGKTWKQILRAPPLLADLELRRHEFVLRKPELGGYSMTVIYVVILILALPVMIILEAAKRK